MVRDQNGKTRTGDAGGVHECVHDRVRGTSGGLYPPKENYLMNMLSVHPTHGMVIVI